MKNVFAYGESHFSVSKLWKMKQSEVCFLSDEKIYEKSKRLKLTHVEHISWTPLWKLTFFFCCWLLVQRVCEWDSQCRSFETLNLIFFLSNNFLKKRSLIKFYWKLKWNFHTSQKWNQEQKTFSQLWKKKMKKGRNEIRDLRI